MLEYEKIFRNSGKFRIQKGNTHIKLLVCDDLYFIQGSFNFLSFDGIYTEDTRTEIATYSESKREIEELRTAYFNFN